MLAPRFDVFDTGRPECLHRRFYLVDGRLRLLERKIDSRQQFLVVQPHACRLIEVMRDLLAVATHIVVRMSVILTLPLSFTYRATSGAK